MQLNTLIRILALALLGIMLFILFVGGSQPIAVNLFPPPLDKLVHALTFGALFIISSLAFPKVKLLYLWLAIIFIGVLDESHQLYLPGRSPGLDDLLADIVGSLCAFLTMHYQLLSVKK